jgi:hypothetical protein
MSGSSLALESLETTFGQNFNGDGTLGVVTTVIESSGATTLAQVTNTYSLYAHGTTTGPQVKISGAAVTAGQFGAWTPLGAEPMAGGYQIVWKNGGADQYVVWTVDGSSNWLAERRAIRREHRAASARARFQPGLQWRRWDHGKDRHRVLWIDDVGQDHQHLRCLSDHQRAGLAAHDVRCGGHGWPVRQLTPIGAEQAANGTYQAA